MYLTKKQFSFTVWIFLIALVFAIAEFVFSYYTQVTLKQSLYADGTPLFFDIKYTVEILLFWLIVFYFTKDAKASFLSMALQLFIGYFFYLWGLLFPEIEIFGVTGVQSLDVLIGSFPYLLFGFLHFKNNRWWLFLIFHLASTGLYLSDSSQQIGLITKYTDYDFQRLFLIKVDFEDGYFTNILWPSFFTTNFLLVWQYILFFCCYNLVKIGFDRKKLQLLDIVNHYYDSLNFTIIFWISRWTLMLMIFAMADSVYRSKDFNGIDLYIIWGLCAGTGVFAFVSIHRNMVTSYLLSKGLKVGWNFIFLNAPLINFFIWLYIIIKKRVHVNDVAYRDNALKDFANINRNKTLRSFILTINVIILFLFIIRFVPKENFHNTFPVILALSIGIIAVVMFYLKLTAVYVYYIILAVLLLATSFVSIPLFSMSLLSTMITLMLWIPLFYLDKMNFVSAKTIEA